MRNLDVERDLNSLCMPNLGQLVKMDNQWEPYRLVDAAGEVVVPASLFFAELQAADRSHSTIRSYGHDLLRWWRFLAAVDILWDQATQAEGRDFARWMKLSNKPSRPHWRQGKDAGSGTIDIPSSGAGRRKAVPPNPVTGRTAPGPKYSERTRAHAETVVRAFYDFHLAAGRGPIVNPFPLQRSPGRERPNAHHNPMDVLPRKKTGRYRPVVPTRRPKRIPDQQFNELFAGLKYNRDRALLAFWISTGARAEELLTVPQRRVSPGEQLIGVTRKGTRTLQLLPASTDAFVWLRLYQQELWRTEAPRGPHEPLWLTLRRPWRPLTYPAARAMFMRAQALLGSNWTLHQLRHTAAYRMAQDPTMPLTDVQWILGHAHLSTTEIYLEPDQDEVIARALAHHNRQPASLAAAAPVSAAYSQTSLDVLFGGRR